MRLRATPQRRIETSGYISGHYRHAPSPRLSAARGIVIHRLNLHSPLPRAGRRVRVGTRFRRAASAQKFTSINFSAGPPVHRSLTERHPVPGGRERGKGSAAAGPFPFFLAGKEPDGTFFFPNRPAKPPSPPGQREGNLIKDPSQGLLFRLFYPRTYRAREREIPFLRTSPPSSSVFRLPAPRGDASLRRR